MNFLKGWEPLKRVDNAQKIAAGLGQIPAHWSLTPLQDKTARRNEWQTEGFIPHEAIFVLSSISWMGGEP